MTVSPYSDFEIYILDDQILLTGQLYRRYEPHNRILGYQRVGSSTPDDHQFLLSPSPPTMTFSCYACGHTTTRPAGLTNHKKTCREHLRRVGSVTETFLKNDNKRRAEKRTIASGWSQSSQKRSKTQGTPPSMLVSKANWELSRCTVLMLLEGVHS